ncbi:hypothetical protein B0H14DRAFT_2581804 [Mycena olivaceomarginata]|nr:hypothetical protein B0H14DRAFT_2581804 [Mycena olivaceomarginata]
MPSEWRQILLPSFFSTIQISSAEHQALGIPADRVIIWPPVAPPSSPPRVHGHKQFYVTSSVRTIENNLIFGRPFQKETCPNTEGAQWAREVVSGPNNKIGRLLTATDIWTIARTTSRPTNGSQLWLSVKFGSIRKRQNY